MTISFAEKMRQRFATRAAERAAESAAAVAVETPAETQPEAAGAVAGKLPVSGPPPKKERKPRAPRPLSPAAIRKVLNRASVAGAFDHVIATYHEAMKGAPPRTTKLGREKAQREAAVYFQNVRDAASELVGQVVDRNVARVLWSKTNQRPSFRTPQIEKAKKAAKRAAKKARKR